MGLDVFSIVVEMLLQNVDIEACMRAGECAPINKMLAKLHKPPCSFPGGRNEINEAVVGTFFDISKHTIEGVWGDMIIDG